MDGYAVRAVDVRGARSDAPVELPVTETIAAGGAPSAPLAPKTAVRIMTGAPIPEGADSVIRIEDTNRRNEELANLLDLERQTLHRLSGLSREDASKRLSRGL